MSRGILIIAFGKAYDQLAAHTIRHSRQFTDLPICVFSNILKRSSIWKEIGGVEFLDFPVSQDENRGVKTQMVQSTPFDETLYLDCDSVIQKPGIEKVFEYEEDLVLNSYLHWNVGDKIIRLYRRVMKTNNVTLPLTVYNGAFIRFLKNEKVESFFHRWHRFWVKTGAGREMPPLNCAIKKSDISVAKAAPYFFEPDKWNKNCIVQHNYNSNAGKNWFEAFNLPVIKQNKPFDKHSSDWNWVDFEE